MKKKMPDEAMKYFREVGAQGGKKAAKGMTKAQRVARATKASKAAAKVRKKGKE